MSKSKEIMVDEIAAQAKIFDVCGADIMQQVEGIFKKTNIASKIDRVYITGCGDSFCAALACRDFFLKYTKVHVEVYQALDFSRYVCPTEVDERAIVLSISSSGRVARTVECALRAREKGAFSIGITGNPKSKLAEAAGNSVVVKIPDVIGVAPGTQSYMASLLAVICFAVALGKEKGVLDDAGGKVDF